MDFFIFSSESDVGEGGAAVLNSEWTKTARWLFYCLCSLVPRTYSRCPIIPKRRISIDGNIDLSGHFCLGDYGRRRGS
jgi:hypothetical protein